jgi:endonuclease YncB( thermonuclease family)
VVVVLCCLASTPVFPQSVRIAEVARVIDGDTLTLTSGETIRLAGINTPEMAYKSRPGEPLAVEARDALQTQVSSGWVGVETAPQIKDRYGRTLAYLFTSDGASIQAALLRAGLASAVVISPNDRYLEEFTWAEDIARRFDRGIWALPYYAPHPPDRVRGGYQFVHGRLSRIKIGEKWFIFSLNQKFVILVRRTDWQAYFGYSPWALDQATIVARGWVSQKKSRATLVISHPFMLERCSTDPQRLCPAN